MKKNLANPLITELYIGVPGAGKTTIAAYYAKKYLRAGFNVWSNVPIKGCKKFSIKDDLGVYDVSNGVLILDELGIDMSNRKWKSNLSDAQMDWLKRHRHHFMHILCFSQGLDFDNRFIGLAQKVYIVSKPAIINKWFTKTKLVYRNIGVDEEKKDIVDNFAYYPFVIGRNRYFYMPSVWDMFDSWEAPKLPTKEWEVY